MFLRGRTTPKETHSLVLDIELPRHLFRTKSIPNKLINFKTDVMLKARIIKIDSIEFDKAGNRIDLTVIRTSNSQLPIIRNAKEFLTDLKNSRLLTNRAVQSIWHSDVQDICKELERGGTVQGNVSYNKIGDKWTVTENSSCVANPNHPQYGTWTVGMQIPVEKPQAIIEGFLNVDYSEQYHDRIQVSKALAKQKLEMEMLLREPIANATVNTTANADVSVGGGNPDLDAILENYTTAKVEAETDTTEE